jgi:leucyl aminopeptidase (aminopeptidase T)
MDKFYKGALQATKNMSLRQNEKVLIVCEKANVDVAKKIGDACLKKTRHIHFFVLEDFGKRPLKELPKYIANAASKSSVAFYLPEGAMEGKINERFTVRMPLTKIVTSHKGRVAAMIGIDKACMEQGMNVDYKKIASITKKVFDVVSVAGQITVSTKHGTAIVAEFSRKLKWQKADGLIRPGSWSNLPDGEVFTCPLNVNGVAVINGSLGAKFSRKYGNLSKTPVTWCIENSRVVEVACPKDKKLEREFSAYISHDKNSNRIGEFAIGTNIAVKKIIGNLLQDEKIPGVHMAVGNPYPEITGANWRSNIHCDGVMPEATVHADGKLLMKSGKFLL